MKQTLRKRNVTHLCRIQAQLLRLCCQLVLRPLQLLQLALQLNQPLLLLVLLRAAGSRQGRKVCGAVNLTAGWDVSERKHTPEHTAGHTNQHSRSSPVTLQSAGDAPTAAARTLPEFS